MTAYLLAAPAVEPVTLDQAKAYLKLDTDDEDALVTTLISAARMHVEGVTARALINQSWRVVLDDWPMTRMLRLPVAPLVSLTAITAYDDAGNPASLPLAGVLWDATASPAVLFLPDGYGAGVLPRQRQGIEIDYVAGYGTTGTDVPAVLCQALLTLVAYWFENRDAVLIAGSGSVVPAGIDMLLAPYRSVRL